MYPQNQLAGKYPPQRFVNSVTELTKTTKSGGTLTLTKDSNNQQYLTGTSSHIVVLPVVATLIVGTQFDMENGGSSGSVTVRSSGGNDIVVLSPGISAIFSSVSDSGTDASVWSFRQKTIPVFNVATEYATASQQLNLAPNANYSWSFNNYQVSRGVEFTGTFFTCIVNGWYAISLISKSSFQPVVIEWRFSKPSNGIVTGVSIGATYATFTCTNGFTNGQWGKVSGSLIDAYDFTRMTFYNVTGTSFDIRIDQTTGVGGGSNGLDVANITELWTNAAITNPQYFPSVKGQLSVATSNGPQIVNYEGVESYSTSVSTTSNGVDLAATSNVYVTFFPNGLPSSGEFQITTSTGVHVVSYTGFTGTTTTNRRFTGCSGGTGIMSTGNPVLRTRFLNVTSPGTGILSTGGNIELSLKTASAYTSGGIACSPSADYTAQYFFTGFINGLLSQKLHYNTVQYLEFGDKFYFRNPGIWTIAGGSQALRIESLF